MIKPSKFISMVGRTQAQPDALMRVISIVNVTDSDGRKGGFMSKKANSSSTNQNRRSVLKSMLVTGGATGAFSGLPASWKKPMVASVMLPAHAATSPAGVGSLSDCAEGVVTFGPVESDFAYTFTVDFGAGTISDGFFQGDYDNGTFSASGDGFSRRCCKDGAPAGFVGTLSGTIDGTSTHAYSRYCGDGRDVLVNEGSLTGNVSELSGSVFTIEVESVSGSYCPDLFDFEDNC